MGVDANEAAEKKDSIAFLLSGDFSSVYLRSLTTLFIIQLQLLFARTWQVLHYAYLGMPDQWGS